MTTTQKEFLASEQALIEAADAAILMAGEQLVELAWEFRNSMRRKITESYQNPDDSIGFAKAWKALW